MQPSGDVTTRQTPNARQRFYDCYPFHPETLRIITERLASNNDFQRVRGTLRAAAAVIHHGPAIAEPLIHPYNLDVSVADVWEELVHRTGHQALEAAIQADITGPNATAQRFGTTARRAANIILLGSLAPTANNGLADAEIVNGLISPAEPDDSVAMQAVRNMKENGLYIDDNPDAGATRFSEQANVRREVEQRANAVSESEREDGIVKAIREAFFEQGGIGITVFPTRANNVPDDLNLVHIGILNPNHITMWSKDRDVELDNFYRYSEGNGGNAPRNHRNNVLFLVPDNGDLAEIKQQIARHKAASKMLQNDEQERKLLEYQCNTLERIRQSSHKAVYQGIQRNWVHLYYPETDAQPHRLQRLQHAKLQFPDREGNGQDTIIDFLTGNAVGKMASPRNPALAPGVWADVGLDQAKDAGMTVSDLHGRFAATANRTMFLKRAHFDRALDQARQTGVVVIRNPHGLEISGSNGVSYQDDMRVWLAEHAPVLKGPGDGDNGEGRGHVNGGDAPPAIAYIPPFRSQIASGKVAMAKLNTRMASYNLDWPNVAKATVYGVDIDLLNDMASQAQSRDATVAISYEFQTDGFDVQVTGRSAEQWLQCSRVFAQMPRIAGVADETPVNVAIAISSSDNADDAVETILNHLDSNAYQITLEVQFHQPDA